MTDRPSFLIAILIGMVMAGFIVAAVAYIIY